MNRREVYETYMELNKIRNVVLLGHGGAGKTTVVEALALLTGVTKTYGQGARTETPSAIMTRKKSRDSFLSPLP